MFRSQVAEAYFKKINKKVKVESAGLIKGYPKLDKRQIKIAKEFGINLKGKSKNLSIDLIKKQNLIVIVANDVSKSVFDRKEYINFKKTKIIKWKILDAKNEDYIKGCRIAIKNIIKKIDKMKIK